jgi:hypothetical protein
MNEHGPALNSRSTRLRRRAASGVVLGGLVAMVGALVLAPTALAGTGKVSVVDRIPADAGKSVKLFSNHDFKVTGTCEDNGGGDFTANTFLSARRNNLAYSAYGPATGFDPFDADFDKADGKIDFTASDASGSTPNLQEAEYYEFYGEGKGGKVLRGHVATSVHLKGADCNFAGVFIGASGSGPVHAVSRIKADAGEHVKIYANDDFKVTGTCEDNGGGDFTANTFVKARQNNLQLYSTSLDQVDADFDKGDPAFAFVDPSYLVEGTAPEFQSWSYYDDFYAHGRHGQVLQGRVGAGVHVKGADCTFSGTFIGPQSGGALHVRNAFEVKAGNRKTFYENHDFKVTAKCIDNGGGDLTAHAFLVAKRDNLDFYSYDGDVDMDLDRADGSQRITFEEATGTTPDFRSVDQYSDFHAEGRGGKVLAGRVASGVHIKGADCTFSGLFSG